MDLLDIFMTLTKKQKSILYGHLLGDGSIDHGIYNRFHFGQKEDNKEWVEHAHKALMPFTKDRVITKITYKKTGKQYKKQVYYGYSFRTCCHEIFSTERLRWYKENKPYSQKIIPDDLVLDWQMIALWYADDGCNWQKGKWVVLNSQSFTKEDNLKLIQQLQNLGIKCTINKKGRHYTIRITAESYYDFINGVKPYLKDIKCMAYKIDTNIAQKRRNYCDVTYSEEVKEQAKQMREQGLTNVEISKKLKAYRKTIAIWLGRKNKSTPKLIEKKQQALDLWNKNIYTKAEISRMLGVHRKTISRWITQG